VTDRRSVVVSGIYRQLRLHILINNWLITRQVKAQTRVELALAALLLCPRLLERAYVVLEGRIGIARVPLAHALVPVNPLAVAAGVHNHVRGLFFLSALSLGHEEVVG